jgi:Rrf2 family nitric oxide-sensitive transcriptional repressor
MAADRIRVGDIVRLTERDMDVVDWFDPERRTCPLIGICRLLRTFRAATAGPLAVLDDVTIADIAATRGELMACVDAPSSPPRTEARP